MAAYSAEGLYTGLYELANGVPRRSVIADGLELTGMPSDWADGVATVGSVLTAGAGGYRAVLPKGPVLAVDPSAKPWRAMGPNGTPSNGLIGAHSGGISDDLPNYAVQVVRNNPDGTSSVKLVLQFSDGNVSKIKSSTLFPSKWSDLDILESIQPVGSPRNAVATRISDGSTLYQGVVNGVNMEVIKIGSRVTSAYPTGGGFTSLEAFGLAATPPKP